LSIEHRATEICDKVDVSSRLSPGPHKSDHTA
jgi:hypothetical protein